MDLLSYQYIHVKTKKREFMTIVIKFLTSVTFLNVVIADIECLHINFSGAGGKVILSLYSSYMVYLFA